MYGTFIRYILLSTLKIQITFGFGLAIGDLIEPTTLSPIKDKSYRITAVVFLTLLSLAPFYLGLVLYRKRAELS